MTYKKYNYRKTIKRKKRGGTSLLNATKLTSGLTSSSIANATKLTSGLTSSSIANATKLTSGLTSSSGELTSTLKGGLAKKIPVKLPKTPYMKMAEFILKLYTKSRLNLSLANKVFKSPVLRENKYKDQIKQLTSHYKENFICACKLIYLYYYDEYAHKFSFMIDNSQEIDNICQIFYIINQQLLLYNSSKKKLPSHFNEVFNNNNFSNLYNENLIKKEYDCNVMKSKIQALFKIGENDYSYIILYLLYDLLKQKKICDFSKELENILENCEEKQQYEMQLKIINPL